MGFSLRPDAIITQIPQAFASGIFRGHIPG